MIFGNIQQLDTPEHLKDFLSKFSDEFKIQARFNKCNEFIEVKVKSVNPQEDGTFTLEFASEKDARLYFDNYKIKPIRMIFI